MSRKRITRTSKKKIVEYWSENWHVCDSKLNYHIEEIDSVCWCCGYKTQSVQRCHIIADSLGGPDVPGNYVLMCEYCHSQAPNTNNSDDIWDYFKSKYNHWSKILRVRIHFYEADQLLEKRSGYNIIGMVRKYEKYLNPNFSLVNELEKEINKAAKHSYYINTETYYRIFLKIEEKIKQSLIQIKIEFPEN